MSTTVVEIAPLTAEDVKALKKAEKIIFRYYQGNATIEASLDGSRFSGESDTRIFTAAQQMIYPRTDGSMNADRVRIIHVEGGVSAYTVHSSLRRGGEGSQAFAWFPSAQYSDRWWTISSLLRVGDTLSLAFEADGYSNGITREAGVHADTLTLRIRRQGAQRDLVLLVDVSVCYDNSARMVRAQG